MSIKMLREHLCLDAARWQSEWPNDVVAGVRDLIAAIDRNRPLGPDCKHDNRHTATCGCEDK